MADRVRWSGSRGGFDRSESRGTSERLKATGDLTGPDPADPEIFDTELEAAVKTFQKRHGIDADGKVGPGSIEELNVPVEARINQFRASLERMRWVFRDLPSTIWSSISPGSTPTS